MLNSEADILRAFEDRAFALSDAGSYERDYDSRQQAATSAKGAEAAERYVASLGLGDMIPSPHEYDYAAMLADGFHPKPDGAGRLPLPPQYWKPGTLVVRGVDLATGQRVGSKVSLEDMVVDGVQDEGEGLMSEPLKAEDLRDLSIPERNSLEAWLQTRGMQVVAGPPQKIASAKDARRGPGQDAGIDKPAMAMLDMLAGALKGGVAQTLGLPGDIESLVRMLTNTGNQQTMSGLVTGEQPSAQILPTTDDVSAALPPVVPPGAPDAAARTHTADTFQTLGEFAPLPAIAGKVANALKGAKGAAAAGASAAVAADTKKGAP